MLFVVVDWFVDFVDVVVVFEDCGVVDVFE